MSMILTLLLASVLVVALLVLSTNFTLSAQKSSVGQGQLLTAQYAAESGVNRGLYRMQIIQNALASHDLEFQRGTATVNADVLRALATDFCDGGTVSEQTLPTPTAADMLKKPPPTKEFNAATRFTKCLAPQNSVTTSRLNLLAKLASKQAYKRVFLMNGETEADAEAKAQTLYTSSESERAAWWVRLLSGGIDTESGNVNYSLNGQVRNFRVDTFYQASSPIPSAFRFYFKAYLNSKGQQQGTNNSRIIEPSGLADNNGIYWIDLQPMTAGAGSFDSSCSNSRFTYTGNTPINNITGTVSPDGDTSITNEASGCQAPPTGANPNTVTIKSVAQPGSNGRYEDYYTYLSQYRGSFFDGEEVNGDLFTNEFFSFSKEGGVTFNGAVASAGCVRKAAAAGSLWPDFSTCPTQVRDALATYNGSSDNVMGLEKIYVNSISSRYNLTTKVGTVYTQPSNTQLTTAIKDFSGNRVQFNGPAPIFDAPYRKLFNTPENVTLPNGTVTQIDPQFKKVRDDAIGNASTTGIKIEDLVFAISPDIQYAIGYQSGKTPDIVLYSGLNARVELQAADGFNGLSPVDVKEYNATTGSYDLSDNAYQYIKIHFDIAALRGKLPDNTDMPVGMFGLCSANSYDFYIRVDSANSIQIYQPSDLGNVCRMPVYGSTSTWKDLTDSALLQQFPGLSRYSTLVGTKRIAKTFNGAIFGDGIMQVRNANPRQGPIGGLIEHSGDPSTYSPAVAHSQNLRVGSLKNMYVISDLTLQDRPVDGNNMAAPNRLSLYSGADIRIGSWSEIRTNREDFITPSDTNMGNLHLDANIVTPNGQLRLATSLVEENQTSVIVFLNNLEILGSVVGKYNMEVGNTLKGLVYKRRGYQRHMTQDPRGDGGLFSDRAWSVSQTSQGLRPPTYFNNPDPQASQPSDLLNMIWRQSKDQ